MERTLKEWFEYYEKHNHLPVGWNQHGNYPEGAALYWDKNKGYVVLIREPETKMMVVWEVCGDVCHWVQLAVQAAKDFNYDKVGGRTGRNVRAYLRKLGAKIIQVHTESNGMSKYICKDKDNNLVVASEGIGVSKEIYNGSPVTIHTIILYIEKKVEV